MGSGWSDIQGSFGDLRSLQTLMGDPPLPPSWAVFSVSPGEWGVESIRWVFFVTFYYFVGLGMGGRWALVAPYSFLNFHLMQDCE